VQYQPWCRTAHFPNRNVHANSDTYADKNVDTNGDAHTNDHADGYKYTNSYSYPYTDEHGTTATDVNTHANNADDYADGDRGLLHLLQP
jgi:hypothetical protein